MRDEGDSELENLYIKFLTFDARSSLIARYFLVPHPSSLIPHPFFFPRSQLILQIRTC